MNSCRGLLAGALRGLGIVGFGEMRLSHLPAGSMKLPPETFSLGIRYAKAEAPLPSRGIS